MSASGNRSYSSGSSATESLATPGYVYLCYCGIRSPLVTSWTHENPGRRLFGCPNYKRNGCKFFKWFDPPMCARSAEVILGIKYNCEVYEATNLSLRRESEDRARKIDELENVVKLDQSKINDLVNETKMKDVRIAELEDRLLYVENKNHYFEKIRRGFGFVIVVVCLAIVIKNVI